MTKPTRLREKNDSPEERRSPEGRLWRELLQAVPIGLVASCVVAAVDAHSLGVKGGLAVVGLVAPFIVGLCVVGAVLAYLAHSGSVGFLALSGGKSEGHPLDSGLKRAAWALLAPPLLLVCVLLSGTLALRWFALDAPVWSQCLGAGLSLVLLASGSLVLGDLLAARAAASGRALPNPRLSLLLSGTLASGAVILMVSTGDPSGLGAAWSRLAVLRREGLELTPVALLAGSLFAGYQGARALRRVPTWAALIALLAPAPLLAASDAALDEPELSLQVEQQTQLTAPLLRQLRRRLDRDGDGFAARLGGGDCNDSDPQVFPGAQELYDNGIDEDCSGRDDAAPAVQESEAPKVEPEVGEESPAVRGERGPLNVLLITVDTLRYDLGFAGYARPVSPNLDALAKRSTVFERAYALASYTGKSLGPMLIGRYPSETHRGWMHFNRYPTTDVFIQERLKQSGMKTISVQGHWYFKENTGLGRGFDVLDLSAAPKVPQAEGDRTVNSDKISSAAITQLEALNSADRFFMWVHYMDPHAEYVRHEDFDFGKKGRDLYDGEVAYTDKEIGRLLTALEQSPFAANTAIALTSDHGEAFGEHGMYRHGFELWEELVRVPLVVHVPGQAPSRVAQRRSAIDLVPTLLEAARGSLDDDTKGQLSGKSLLPDILSEKGTPKTRPIFLDMPAGPYNSERQGFIDNDLKLTVSNMRPMGLYDLAKDPDEKHNLVKKPEVKQAALERFKQFRNQLKLVHVKPK